jgi:hypothetical protein
VVIVVIVIMMMMIPNPSFRFWASIKNCTLASSNLCRVTIHDAVATNDDDDASWRRFENRPVTLV